MTGADKPGNKVIVLIVGPPRSGKTELAREIAEAIEHAEGVEAEDVSIFLTNDARAFDEVLGMAKDVGVES